MPLNNWLLKLVVRVERALVCVEKGRYVERRKKDGRAERKSEQASALKARKE